ncbi:MULTISPECIES: glycosyltransferase family 4 protein [Aminobacterium]|jgi:glycosyltransferase involved in cell wall biosynthesis|uniref:glycosyltransferase family 4 protein n=1 Tax=Aminobacterium TaxID=81466 RepID=UPI0025796344|nr:glycosyltransferase family 4 protein [Aminobacterium sp. UBA4987]
MRKRICHITTVHSANDIRIFAKECQSLSQSGYEVFLVAPETPMSLTDISVKVKFIHKEHGRFLRLIRGQWHALKEAVKLKASLYHFHDPELILMGLILKFIGKKVVYDVHEDLPRQIRTKEWLPSWSRKGIAFAAEFVEWIGAKFFDGIVIVAPVQQHRFPSHKTIMVQNFPIREEFLELDLKNYSNRPPYFAYIGGITVIRGIKEMVKSLEYMANSQVNLILAGKFSTEKLSREIKLLHGWNKVQYEGFVGRKEVVEILKKAKAGLVLFHPVPNHIGAQPNKFFEYMSAGIPIIASDFPLWRQIVEEAKCGLLVDPLSPEKIAKAMQWVLDHPEEAQKMGRNGLKAIETKYNWDNECKKLIIFYKKLFQK